jgi:predicted permease
VISALRRIVARVRAVFGHADLDREFHDEAAAHIQLAIDENVRRGMSDEDARREALVRFGGVLQSKEYHRNARGLPIVEVAIQDLRYAVRTLRRDPGFAFVAVLMLGLGIGANAAVFSVVNEILLRPLPFEDPQRLVWIEQTKGRSGLSSLTYSVDAYEGFRARNRSFEDVTAYFPFSSRDNYRLGGHGDPLPLTAMSVVGNFFQVLGVKPAIGRGFTPDETRRGGRAAVLLAYPFWQRQFAGDARVVGQVIDLNGQPVTVVGVLPERFDFGAVFSPGTRVDAFVPVIPDEMRDWGNTLSLIGRLRPSVSIERANAEAHAIVPELYFNLKYPNSKGSYTAKVLGLKEHVSGQLRRSLVVLWCAVAFTLLIVCVNLANLLIARTGARTKELSMRAALGAGRGRLIRQLLTESLLLSGAGAVVGLGLASAVTRSLARQGSVTLPLLSSIRLDGAALAWTLLIAAASCIVFGLVPALKMATSDLQSALKDVGHGVSAGRSHHRLRSSLVVSEIALACMLLVGAGLLLRSFLRVLDVDLGFRPAGVAAIKTELGGGSPQQRGVIFEDALRQIRAIPGIEMAGVTDNLPLEGNRSWGLRAKGKQYRDGELPGTFVYVITPGYLETMGMRLRKGRLFDWGDGSGSQPVVVINETAARYLWPGADPVGQMALVNGKDTRVIGVVSDVRETSLEKKGAWQMYLPATQAGPVGAVLTIRSTLPASALAPSILGTLRSLNPAQPTTQLHPIQASVDHAVSPRRFFMLLVAAFAAFGLMLAALGVYGVISYSVAQRTQEIGIRMALGATASRVRRGIMWQTMRLVILGMIIGATAAAALSRLIASMLFETAPTDMTAFVGTMILLAGAALAAAMVPAYRAARVDPMRALRPM